MFGRKQEKIEEYYKGVIQIFQTNSVSVNGEPIPFKVNDFANARDFLRAAVASIAFHKNLTSAKKTGA